MFSFFNKQHSVDCLSWQSAVVIKLTDRNQLGQIFFFFFNRINYEKWKYLHTTYWTDLHLIPYKVIHMIWLYARDY